VRTNRAECSWRGVVHDTAEKGTPRDQWCRDTAPPCPISAGQESGATGLVILSEAKNPEQRALPSCPSCNFVEKTKTPDGSPAQQLTQGRHGPCRDANRGQCLFLLLLSLEESNQRTCGIGTRASIATPLAIGFGA